MNIFLKYNSKDIKFIITNKESRDSVRNPSPPFTTSTLQQDASSKYHFSVKRTMDAAQKLYEAGHITYMRTDSVNLSNEIKKDIKKFVKDKYGDKYYKDRTYSNKSKGHKKHMKQYVQQKYQRLKLIQYQEILIVKNYIN